MTDTDAERIADLQDQLHRLNTEHTALNDRYNKLIVDADREARNWMCTAREHGLIEAQHYLDAATGRQPLLILDRILHQLERGTAPHDVLGWTVYQQARDELDTARRAAFGEGRDLAALVGPIYRDAQLTRAAVITLHAVSDQVYAWLEPTAPTPTLAQVMHVLRAMIDDDAVGAR